MSDTPQPGNSQPLHSPSDGPAIAMDESSDKEQASRSQRAYRHRDRRRQPRSHSRRQLQPLRMDSSLWRPWRRLQGLWQYWRPTKIFSSGAGQGVAVLAGMLRLDSRPAEKLGSELRVAERSWPSIRMWCNPLWWFQCAGMFCWRWLVTRRYLPLLLAAPAAFVALGVIGAISAGNAISLGTHSLLYKKLLARELDQVDQQQARLALAALVRLDPNNPAPIYDTGLLLSQSGDVEAATQIMTELATFASSAPAAMWMADAQGDWNSFDSWPKQQKINYHHWLQLAAAHAPDDPRPRQRLGQVRARVGNKAGAYEVLLPIADTSIEVGFEVYLLERDLGMADRATCRSEKLERELRSALEAAPQDTVCRTMYAKLLAIRGQFSEAREVLSLGRSLPMNEQQRTLLNQTIAELLVMQAAAIPHGTDATRGLVDRMQHLLQAAEAAPQHPQVLEAVTQACFDSAEVSDSETAQLREMLIANISPDTSHFILGTLALKKGDMQEARQHLELAAKDNPHMPGFLNNLAHVLCYAEPPDLNRALQIANAANDLHPNNPHLRETRGQIYLKLQRYTDAIADLEVALNAPELQQPVRESLAAAYEALGQHEIARRHRELALPQ